MKNKNEPKWILNMVLAFIILIFISACGGGGNSENTNNDPAAPEPDVGNPVSSDQEERITLVEEVEQNNCDGPETSISKTVNLSQNQSWSASISGSLQASAPGISASIGSALTNSYGQTKGMQTTINLTFPAGTHQLYTVEHYEVWENGSIGVTVGQELFSVPYAYRISADIRSFGPEKFECPLPESPRADFSISDVDGTVPFTVTFEDLSVGAISSWKWDFGDGNTSNEQNPSHTYQESSYKFDLAYVCFEREPFSVSLRVENAGGANELRQEAVINVLPTEYSVTTQVEPHALTDGSDYKLLRNPGCSQVCGFDLTSGRKIGGACLTSIESESYDEVGYYFGGQVIGLQAKHEIKNCSNSSSSIQPGIWRFSEWEVVGSSERIDPNMMDTTTGDHNPKITVDKDYYILVHYLWDRDCP